MSEKLLRVGTTYLPVRNVELSANWYVTYLQAVLSYQDEDKAIVNFADQSFFLVKAEAGETSNFKDSNGHVQFSLTFEVDGLEALQDLHQEFTRRKIKVGEIEDRGHAGKNFVFSDPNGNKFDVWSEVSPAFKWR